MLRESLTSDKHRRLLCCYKPVIGRLDYPALLDIETELGKALDTEILIDLGRITEADREAAWSLCDAIGREPGSKRISAIVSLRSRARPPSTA